MTSARRSLVRAEIWSDPQCVWCFIAHPRFEKAVAAFNGEVEVTYRSFELRPDAPVEIDKKQQIAQHAGPNRERIDAINAQLTVLADAEGLSYRPGRRTHASPLNCSTMRAAPDNGPRSPPASSLPTSAKDVTSDASTSSLSSPTRSDSTGKQHGPS